MRQLRAILGDSLRESIDRRALLVLMLLALVPILFCFSLSVETEPLDEVLVRQSEDVTRFSGGNRRSHNTVVEDATVTVGEARAVTTDEFGAKLRGGYQVELAFGSRRTLDDLALAWLRFNDHVEFKGQADNDVPDLVDGVPRGQRFLEERFGRFGYEYTAAREIAPGRWVVAVHTDYPNETEGAFKVTAGFGAWQIPHKRLTFSRWMAILQTMLAGIFAGFIGLLVALAACSSFVPNMLQKGTLDLALARPIGRGKLLLAKYVGGLWFVLCLATFLVGGCWIGLAVGSGYSNPWFLLAVPVVTVSFGVLYSVAVLVGVATRSAGVSLIAALGVWFVSSNVVRVRHMLRIPGFGDDAPEWVKLLLEVAYTVLPKVKDLELLGDHVLAQSHLSEAARKQVSGAELPAVDWLFSAGTTALFTAAMLGLAVWLFRRRDY